MARKAKYTEQLPPVPCTPEMRARVVEIAEREERSISDIQREALTLFLSENDSKSIITKSTASEDTAP